MLLPVSPGKNLPAIRPNNNTLLRFAAAPNRVDSATFSYPDALIDAGAPLTPADNNQVSLRVNYNLATDDKALMEAIRREGGRTSARRIGSYGKKLGSEEVLQWGFDANENPPELKPRTPTGRDRYEVKFHPTYDNLMALSKKGGLHNVGWLGEQEGSQIVRSAMFYLMSQVDAGHCCPISMTHAALPALMPHTQHSEVLNNWVEKIKSPVYDGRAVPASQKTGVTLGMGLTEMQGGTDVPLNQTVAEAVDNNKRGCGREYRLAGHKWFMSAPMSDGFLVTAYTEKGLGCFLVPRWKEDGSPNFVVKRLKNKLGDKSNASSEVEFRNSQAWLIDEEGNGLKTILQMVNSTRLDCMLGSAGQVRQALVQALHFANTRVMHGQPLIKKALQQNVLADLALESEAATLLSMRMARAFDDAAAGDDSAIHFARIGTAIGKYWICKRAPEVVKECMEALGGNGYVEDFNLARLHRQSPLNGIWEGSGNVMCLEALRGLGKSEILNAFLDELNAARGKDDRYDQFLDQHLLPKLGEMGQLLAQVKTQQVEGSALEWPLREVADLMALALEGSLMLKHSTPEMADAFCGSRLVPSVSKNYGTLSRSIQPNAQAILNRAYPDGKL